jgi:putative ABC transport system ATP-binding protein
MDHETTQLSGGQQQRVAIARALVNQPSVILADEPTGALDSKTSLEILDLFRELNDSGITVLVVTHDQEVADEARRSLFFRDGEIVSDTVVAN